MLVHHRGNHGGARAKNGSDGGGGVTGRGQDEGGGGGRGGRGIIEEISVSERRAQLRLRKKTFPMPSLLTPSSLSLVLVMVSMSIPVPVSSPFTTPQKVVFPTLALTLCTHSDSVSVSARTHLQPHWTQTLQTHPIILRSCQRMGSSVGEQPSPFGTSGPLTSSLFAVALTLQGVQRVLQGVAASS